ncbi:MAG: response regulator [Candidatus Promineifilaceae bacterium]|nr:response regulator [Candidatus Promineifilaceae bacterium]
MRVLYIEDDIGSQRLVSRVLENKGYDVVIASEGLQGIHLARESRPSLILMDLNLPGMNGREITTRLRSLPNFERIPIVALTANTSPGHREQALAAGCDGFLTKPINISSFPDEVTSFLEGYREELESDDRLVYLERHAQQIVTRLEAKIHELEDANRRLRELDRMKSNFIALVSHELRTPLTLLEGYSHLLEHHLEEDESVESSVPGSLLLLVRGLDTGIKRISNAINEIINVSRIASGRLELAIGPVRISELVHEVVQQYALALRERHLHLEVTEAVDMLPLIEADGSQLIVAIENVVGNAIKYTPDGGHIIVDGREVGNAVDLVIKDTGIGIPLHEQRRIFDKFYVLQAIEHHSSSKSAFKGGGLGLGLAIAKGVVEAHNGRIWVDSQGENAGALPGSAFHLLLPIRQPRQR